jgi:ankyrin repeat protein
MCCSVWLAIEDGALIDAESFIYACAHGHTEIVRLFLDLEREVYNNAALRYACIYGRAEIVRMLLDLPLDSGVNPSAVNNQSLRYACIKGHTEIVRMLLDCRWKEE